MGKTALNPAQPERILAIMRLLFSKPEYISIAYSCLDGGREYDLFAHALLEYAEERGTSLSVLRNVLLSEFQANVGTPTAIMRGNSATSRIMGIYCRKEGASFLRGLLTDVVRSVISEDVNFEIQREMLGSDAEQKENLKSLLGCAESVLKTITSPDSIAEMPRSIRALASFIAEFAAEFSEENKQTLVGGFVMLRLINPSILAPDAYGICDCTPSMKGRRNLILLCKIIQGISNKRTFNEEWMLDCNAFMEEHLNDLDDYFKEVVRDEQALEGVKPFSDLLNEPKSETANRYALSFSSYEFMNWMLLEYKEALLEGLESYLARQGITPETLQLVELINDYEELPLDTSKMELYISGICPYSRAVWLFCLANKIDVTYHKLDLFTDDHSIDMQYKKFEKVAPYKEVPVLVDGDFVLAESSAIVAYLCNKFLLPSNWFPKTSPEAEALTYQYLEWTLRNLQLPLSRLWIEVQRPKADASNLVLSDFPDFVTAVEKLEHMYPKARRMLKDIREGATRPTELSEDSQLTSKYLFGNKPSFVDVIVVTMLSFAQVLQGFTVSSYKNLTAVMRNFLTDHKSDWKAVNYEFEGLLNYIITVTTRNSMPQVKQLFCFQQIPSTVFELLLDPENDIFLVLASKTISNKGNAKVKQGLKKLDNSTGADGAGEDSLPYVVSLEIGGNFQVQGREGTNLMLVSGSKILQISRLGSWEPGVYSTELFDLKPHAAGHTVMELTQTNFPNDTQKDLEEMWTRMWKKLNGIRVDTIVQTVYFKGKSPAQAYISLSDWRVFSKMTKSKVKEEPNGWVNLFGNKVSCKVDKLQPHSNIKQTWRYSDWPEDHVADLHIGIDSFDTNSSRVSFTLKYVPYEKLATIANFWKSSVWKKFGAVLVEDIEQVVYFPQPVDDVYRMWLDEATMSARLKTKCNIEKGMFYSFGVGGMFSPYGIKCVFTQLSKNKRIAFSYAQKDWPTGHQSVVELDFEAINLGPDTETTQLTLTHKNVPAKFAKATYDSWTTDFWVKLSAVQTRDISGSVILRSIGPEALYNNLLDSSKLSGLTSSSCSISAEEGSNYQMYNKSLKGQVVELVPFSKIVLSMRDFEWPYSHLSTFTINLGEMDAGRGVLFSYTQTHVPIQNALECAQKWDTFLKKLAADFK